MAKSMKFDSQLQKCMFIISNWTFNIASEYRSSSVTFVDKLPRYLVNVQRVQVLLVNM